MRDFSAGAAIGAGFRLIAREPLAFLAWTVVLLATGILPQAWVASEAIAMMGDLMRHMSERAGSSPPAEIFQMQATMMRLQPISLLSTLVSEALIIAAVFRAVLEPDARRFLYLRLGVRELWLGLVIMVLFLLAPFAMFAAIVPFALVAGVFAALKIKALFVLLPLIAMAIAGVGVWAALRMSMAPVMTFAEVNFRLFESWPFTKGHALKMFGVALALVAIGWMLQLFALGVGLAVANAIIPLPELFHGFSGNPIPHLARLGAGFWSIAAVAVGLLSTLMMTLFAAAWTEIYRALRPPAEAAA